MDDNINSGIRAMLIDLVDQIMKRPLYMVVLEDEQNSPFVSLKNDLESNATMTLNQFNSPIKEFFDVAKSKNAKYVSDAANVLEKFYDKRMNLICSFNDYRFKDILLEAAQKAFPGVESFSQASDDKMKELVSIPHRGKRTSKSVRIIQNDQQDSNADDEYTDKNDDSLGE